MRNKKKKWTKEENEIIKKYYLTKSKKEIEKLFIDRIYRNIQVQSHKIGIIKGLRKIKWTQEEIDFVKKYYISKTKEEFAKLIPNRTRKSISLRAHELGVKKRKAGTYSNLSVLLNDNPITYYWIGFLLADGHFAKESITLGLGDLDYDHLIKFKKFVKSNNKINKIERGYRISCGDKNMVQKIKEKFDIADRKTYNPPKNLNKIYDPDLLLSLIIGFIDGDGNISNHKNNKDLSILRIKVYKTWLPILEYFQKFLYFYSKVIPRNNHSTPKLIRNKDKHDYCLLSLSHNSVLAFMKNKVIELKLPVLKRKWDKVDKNYVAKYKSDIVLVNQIKELIKNGEKEKVFIEKELGVTRKTLNRLDKQYFDRKLTKKDNLNRKINICPDWTENEKDIIRDNYLNMTAQELTKLLSGRTKGAIKKRAKDLGVKKGDTVILWTDKENEIIKKYHAVKTLKEMQVLLPGRSGPAISSQAIQALKLNKKTAKVWTDKENKIIRDNYLNIDIENLIQMLSGRSKSSIRQQANHLGVKYSVNYWTEREQELLRRNYKKTYKDIMNIIPRSLGSIRKQMLKLELVR